MSVLSPFLYIGVISEYFKREGNIPVDRDLLHIYANGDDINGATSDGIYFIIQHRRMLGEALMWWA
jgi:hypothetical protein